MGQLGFCETSPTSKQGVMANLDLTINSGDRPKIDGVISMSGDGVYDSNGWTGDEYGSFTKLDMWNQGNEGKELWATGFIAYDCQNKILCVAAHLNEDLLHDSIPQSDAYSWIRFGFDNAEQKLFLHNTDVSEAAYALKPTNSSQAIGYEGCWHIQDHETFGRLAPVTNNYVTIHFDKDTSDGTRRNTVSTGMENGSKYTYKLISQLKSHYRPHKQYVLMIQQVVLSVFLRIAALGVQQLNLLTLPRLHQH